MATYETVNSNCPFLQKTIGKRYIHCEGLIGPGGEKAISGISLLYKKNQDFRIQFETFCCGRYTNCEIYRVLIEKPEYDD